MKKTTLAILALVLVTVATAFTSQRNDNAVKKDATEYAYYEYQGEDPEDENIEENWTLTQTSGNCSPEGTVLCIIQAPMGEDGHPDFTGITDVRNSILISSKSYKN